MEKPDLKLTAKKVTGANSVHQLINSGGQARLAKLRITQFGTNTLEAYAYLGTSANDDKVIASYRSQSASEKGKGETFDFLGDGEDTNGLYAREGIYVKTITGTAIFGAFMRKP